MVTGPNNVTPSASQKNKKVGKKQCSAWMGFETAIVSWRCDEWINTYNL